MKPSLTDALRGLPGTVWKSEKLFIRPIENEDDLWFATVECTLRPGQEEFVNPAGFSIGRAYLSPQDNLPCVVCKADGERIGYIVFRMWLGEGCGTNWSYYLDCSFQGMGYGKPAAELAVRILKTAMPELPIFLSTEAANDKAQRLYQSIGFTKTDQLDGDDWVFLL